MPSFPWECGQLPSDLVGPFSREQPHGGKQWVMGSQICEIPVFFSIDTCTQQCNLHVWVNSQLGGPCQVSLLLYLLNNDDPQISVASSLHLHLTIELVTKYSLCLLYTSDAADDWLVV